MSRGIRARHLGGLAAALAAATALSLLLLLGVPSARSAPSAPPPAPVASPPPLRGLDQARADRPDPARHAVRPPWSAATLPTGTWSALGPAPIGPPYLQGGGFYGGVNSGRITGLAIIPSGPLAGRIVAATAGGGIWTSDSDGKAWFPRTDGKPDLATGAVTLDPSNPMHLIAGSGEANQCGDCYAGAGVYVSVNGGNNWKVQNPGGVFTGLHIAQVAIDPSDPNHQFAATDRGLYVTSDGGSTWAKPTSPTYPHVDGNITSVVINPQTPSTVYIGGGAKTVARSTDGGSTWSAKNAGIAQPSPATRPYTALALAPSRPTTVYASVGSNQPVRLYKSVNSGASWNKLKAPDYTGQAYSYGAGTDEQGFYDNVVAVDPANPQHLLAGGIALVESTNGGTTWTNVNGGSFFGVPQNKLHPDQHAVGFVSDGSIWIGSDGGVFHYMPSSAAVDNSNGNLNITQFYYGFNVVGTRVLAGSQDNSSALTTSATLSPWTGISGGDGGPAQITPNSSSTDFIELNTSLFVTTDAFVSTLTNITPPPVATTGSIFAPPEIVIPSTETPSNPTVLYGGQDVFRTTNPTTGANWTKVTSVGSDCATQTGTCVSALTHLGNVVYAGFTNGTVEVSTNGGRTFSPLKAQPRTETFVTGISIDPVNPKAITVSFSFATTRSRLGLPHVEQYAYTSSPGTGTWTTITGSGLPSAVSHVVYDKGALLAATDSGVYGTTAPNGSATLWTKIGTGLPNVQIQDVFVAPSAVYVLTHGRGAWRLP